MLFKNKSRKKYNKTNKYQRSKGKKTESNLDKRNNRKQWLIRNVYTSLSQHETNENILPL